MKRINIILLVIIFSSFYSKAQVKDISFTLSPVGEYTWWDDNAGLKDGTLLGGKLGFGFGEYLELRGVYMQSIDLETSFKDFGLVNYDPTLFTTQDINLTRWGGEFKANIGTGWLKPFLTIGTGVQKIELDATSEEFEQIYGSLGLGFKLNIDKRVVFTVEAKNTTYNFNAGESLLADVDKTTFGVTDADFSSERLSNWSVLGSLQFYLGGRRPGNLSDLDRAYLNKFKGGFQGMQFILEPGGSYIAFDENSLFRDSYFLGGYAGFDFNEYIGIRGFYFQATKKEQISLDFDDLAMYGVEVRARLNDGQGVTPYLVLGGGYLNSYTSYLGKGDVAVNGGEFAEGGLGLNIPLGKNFLITGGVRAMLTSGENLTDLTAPDEIQTHIMYNAGLKIALGKKSVSPRAVYDENLDRELSMQQAMNDAKIQSLKSEYQTKITSLEQEIKLAYEAKDVNKAVELLEEKKETQEALKEVEKVEVAQGTKQLEKVAPKPVAQATPVVPVQQVVPAAPVQQIAPVPSNLIQMTPSEFESLIDKILKGLDEAPDIQKVENKNVQDLNNTSSQYQIDLLNKRIDILEKLLLEVNAKKTSEVNVVEKLNNVESVKNEELLMITQERILDKLKDLNNDIELNAKLIEQNNIDRGFAKTIIVSPSNDNVITTLDEEGEIIENNSMYTGDKVMKYNYASAFFGFNVGSEFSANLGLRGHYNFKNSNLEFMPEIFAGIGNSSTFAISGNIVYPFSINSEKANPYIGVGLGFIKSNNFKGFYNVIIGSKLPVIHENVYVEYTMRNNFDYNQLAIGYRLPF